MNNHLLIRDTLIKDYLPLIGPIAYSLYQYHLHNTLIGRINPSIRTISNETGMDDSAIKKANNVLVRFGLITIIKGDNKKPNGYITHPPSKTKLNSILKSF